MGHLFVGLTTHKNQIDPNNNAKMKSIKPIILLLTAVFCNAWVHHKMPKVKSHSRRSHLTLFVASNIASMVDSGAIDPKSVIIIRPSLDTSDTEDGRYLVHTGRAVNMIKRCVALEGLSVSTGWTPQATAAFKIAIEAVVRSNPILTGKLVEVKKSRWPWSQRSELWIEPNAFPPEEHPFVTMVDPPEDLLSPAAVSQQSPNQEETAHNLFKHVHMSVAPSLLSKASFSANQIEDESPLFEGKQESGSCSNFVSHLCLISQ